MKSISLLIATTAILLLIALISVQADATVDSYAPSIPTKPTIPVDKYHKPRKICKKKCLLHKYIKGKCLKHKLVGKKKVCDKYTVDSYTPKKCRYVKKCKIVSYAKKCCKWKKIKYCKEKKSFKKC